MRPLLVLIAVAGAACPLGPRPCLESAQCDPPDVCLGAQASVPGSCGDPDAPLPDGGEPNPLERVDAISIDVGGAFACGRTAGNEVFCLGSNNSGQMGLPADAVVFNSFNDPIIVPGLSEASDVAVSDWHACAIAVGANGRGVYCWGDGTGGQLGVAGGTPAGTIVQPAVPIVFHADVEELGASTAGTCGRTSAGEVRCWGPDIEGYQPGVSVAQSGLLGAVALRVTDGGVCALLAGALKCADDLSAVNCTDEGGVFDCPGVAPVFAATDTHLCDVLDSEVRCRGDNGFGIADPLNPGTEPAALAVVAQGSLVSLGTQSACAVGVDDSVQCWGRNLFGSTGQEDGVGSPCATTERCHGPLPVDQTAQTVALDTRRAASCALRNDGDLVCWGEFLSQTPLPPTRYSVRR